MVRSSTEVPGLETILMRTQIIQMETAFNPLVNACVVTQTHKGLVNSIAVLVADLVLLLIMLIGLLRHVGKDSAGIWKLLYQQVSSKRFYSLALNTEFHLVYNLDSLGGDCRDTNCSQSRFCRFNNVQLNILKVFLTLNLSGTYSPARACEDGADNTYSVLVDVWNEVRFMSFSFLLVGG